MNKTFILWGFVWGIAGLIIMFFNVTIYNNLFGTYLLRGSPLVASAINFLIAIISDDKKGGN